MSRAVPRGDLGRSAWVARCVLVMMIALAALLLSSCEPTNPPTAPGTDRIVLFGDSLPAWLLGRGSGRGLDHTKFTVVNGTMSACDGSLPFYDARWQTSEVVPVTDACKRGWRKQYPPFLETRPDAAVIMGGTHAMLDHRMNGVWVHPCTAKGRKWAYDDMKARLLYLKAHADRVIVVLPAWPGPNSRWIMPPDYLDRADCVREELRRAADIRHASVIDFGAYLCPTSRTSCGNSRSGNGVHVNEADAARVLAWLLTTVGQTIHS